MKFIQSSFYAGLIAVSILLLASVCTMVSCKPQFRVDLDTVSVNPDFVQHPPIADSVTFQPAPAGTKEGNMIMRAYFKENQYKNPYLAFVPEGQKVVLRDDGEDPDEKAGDGVYTGFLQVDTNELTSMDAELKRQLSLFNDKRGVPVTLFQGRTAVSKGLISPIFLSGLSGGEIISGGFRFPHFPALPIIRTNSLLITDTSVVQDPSRTFNPCTLQGTKMGPWTFGFLMSQLANTPVTGVSAAQFTLNWLKTFTVSQTVNGDAVESRPGMQAFINAWLAESGGDTLDLSIAPFRLMAIVNRLDLMGNIGYGGGANAGEGRFVFCAMNGSCQPLEFTVIFEFGVNKSGCGQIKSYAQEWFNLGSLTLGSPAYNTALQHITDQFSLAGEDPSKPNGSSLNQLRTNEIALSSIWELREFHLDSVSHQLLNATVAKTPSVVIDNTATLDSFVNNEENASLLTNFGGVSVPLFYKGAPFLGGEAAVTNNDAADFHWDGNHPVPIGIHNDTTRMLFSLNTCNGCHSGETKTVFTQIQPTGFGAPAPLSNFLTGNAQPTPDVAGNPAAWTFGDLERRNIFLNNFVNTPCFIFPLFFKPINMVH